jgi:hypothetical protein
MKNNKENKEQTVDQKKIELADSFLELGNLKRREAELRTRINQLSAELIQAESDAGK